MIKRIAILVIVISSILSSCATQTPISESTSLALPTDKPTDLPLETIDVEREVLVPTSTLVPGAFDWSKIKPANEIVFWHQYTGEIRDVVLKTIVDSFNSTNQHNITVITEYAGTYQETYDKMLALQNTYRVPDIVVSYQNQVANYQKENSIFDLNTIIDDPTYGILKEDQDDFIDAFFIQDVYSIYNDQRLGFPTNRNMEVLYYNKDWLKELGYTAPPRTPTEFREMTCKAAKQPFRGRTVSGSTGYQMTIDASSFASWTFAFGGDIFDYETNRFTLNSPETVEAFTFLRGLFADGCATFVTKPYGDQIDFGNGTLLFTLASSSGLPFYYNEVQNGANFEWSVTAVPSTGIPKQNTYGPSISIFNSTPERQLASWIFLKYLTEPEVQKFWAESTGYLPVRRSAGGSMRDLMDAIPEYRDTWNLIDFAWFEPSVPDYDTIRSAIAFHMEAVLKNLNLSIQSEFDTLNSFANEILETQLK